MTDSHSQDPFWMKEEGIGSSRIDVQQLDTIRHEILFEDEVTHLKDERMFVGMGISRHRMVASLIVVFLALGTLSARAGWMQIVHGGAYKIEADDNRFRIEVLPARRGIVRDRNGVVLAENTPSFDVQVRWADLPRDEEERNAVIAKVSRIIGVSESDIKTALGEDDVPVDEWVEISKDIPYEQAIEMSIHLPYFSGVFLVSTAKRIYPHSKETPSLSHVIGYAGSINQEEYTEKKSDGYRRTDEIGKVGIEKSAESQIRGTVGERKTEVDAFGHPRTVVEERKAIDGEDVVSTIDLALQDATEKALKKGIEEKKVSRGSAILMEAKTGEILAIVSWPSYDNNIFTGSVSSTVYQSLLSDENRPLLPRAWAGQFPSGSVIKPLIAVAALEEGIITPKTTVFSVGGINVGPWFFPDWKAGGHGAVNVRSALAWSVNTFFYYIGGGYDTFRGLGVTKLSDWMKRFGLGSVLGLDITGESAGHVPSDQWKKETKGESWYIGDTYNLSIGQGDLLVTPLQIARVTATIANGGKLVVPHVIRQNREEAPASIAVKLESLQVVREGMHDTVTYGSGRRLSSLPFSSAGKTGTAQWRADRTNHAWYTGFAPYEDPEVVVTVLVEEGEEGSSVAVPIAQEILQAWWDVRSKRE